MKIGILGGGQLAGLLAQEIKQTEDTLIVLDPGEQCPASLMGARQVIGSPVSEQDIRIFSKQVDVLTVELENINTEALIKLAAEGVSIIPFPETLAIIKDKLLQKHCFFEAGIPTCEYFSEKQKSVDSLKELGWPLVQKSRTGGYDGRGVLIIRDESSRLDLLPGPTYFEAFVPDAIELAVMVARNKEGEETTWEPTLLEFDGNQNVLKTLYSPPILTKTILRQAKQISIEAVRALGGIGLFGVELFLTKDDRLLINEVAPRAHNSGHHTIESSETSQFLQQYNVLRSKPLSPTRSTCAAVMFNLLGEPGFEGKTVIEGIDAIDKFQNVFVHLYQKFHCSPYRKMGHITVTGETLSIAKELAEEIRSLVSVRGENQI